MPAFRTSGSTGQAPTTTFFGVVPDKLSMLVPAHSDSGSNLFIDSNLAQARNINQWTIFNTTFIGGANANSVTLGAMITAPDGTNTAQRIVETTTNSQHSLSAVGQNGGSAFGSGVTMRTAVFAKAAERTRIALTMRTQNVGGDNLVTVFDLVGGQIGVAPTYTPGADTWTNLAAQIVPFGNGWYLCQMEAFLPTIFQGSQKHILTDFMIDANSGTAAQNTSYVGDVSKGLYAWNSVMLPARAWGLNTPTFFDDFTSLSTIDTGNTKAPGFKWYQGSAWPNPGFQATPETVTFSVSGSVVTIHYVSGTGNNLTLNTAAYDGAGGFVGTAFQTPFLWETNHFFGLTGIGTDPQHTTFWSTNVERFLNPFADIGAGSHGFPACELDPIELVFAEQGYFFSMFYGPNGEAMGGINEFGSSPGFSVWLPDKAYGATTIIGYQGQLYQAQITTTAGHAPPSFPAEWQVFTTSPPNPPSTKTFILDYSNPNNVYSFLMVNESFTEAGFLMLFVNGVYIGFYGKFGPAVAGVGGQTASTGFVVTDTCHFPILHEAQGCGSSGLNIDFVRVTQ